MSIRKSKSYPFEQTGFPIYQVTFLLDEHEEDMKFNSSNKHHFSLALIEFLADGISIGVGGIYIDAVENYVVIPAKFLLNKGFEKVFAELCSNDPINCRVDSFSLSETFMT